MTTGKWHELLARLSDAVIRADEAEELPPALREAGWIGGEPASRQDIEALEQRIGRTLPRSYRTFLETTNGLYTLPPFLKLFWPAHRVEWFVTHNREWAEAYSETAAQLSPLSDTQYLTYGPDQDTAAFRPEYLFTALEVSEVGDSAIVLLNPEVQTPDGEWEAWFFANWLPGAERYRSFWDLMEAKVEFFMDAEEGRLSLRSTEREQQTAARRGTALSVAREAARSGDADSAVTVLRQLAEEEVSGAFPSLAELHAFRGHWMECVPMASRLLADPRGVAGNVVCTMVSLLGRAGDETQDWQMILWAVHAARIGVKKNVGANQLEWYLGLLERLHGYADRKGTPMRAMISEFLPLYAKGTWAERRKEHEEFLSSVRTKNRNLRDNPAALHQASLDSAVRYGLVDESMDLYRSHPAEDFRTGATLARLLVEGGEVDEGWKVLWTAVRNWQPVDKSQVAPADLLCDEFLRRILIRERCEMILSRNLRANA